MISPATIQAIRERTDIVAVIGETMKLVRRGRSFVGLCPFHQERTPSFHVSPDRGFFHCFGCKESGSVFDFLMKTEGLSFREAAQRLAERAGIPIEETGTDAERREADAARRAIEDLYAVNQLAAHWFESQLREHPHARLAHHELEKRELSSMTETLQAFRVGYAPPGWDGLTSYLRTQGVSLVTAERLGLIVPRKSGTGHYDWFRNRLMFSIIDVRGRVVGFSGRILPDPETGLVDKNTGKYVNSPESPIFKKGETLFGLYQARHSIRRRDEAVVVEGNFDVVALHARGIDHVVAPLGTAFTVPQASLLRRFAPSVTLLFDSDEAGQKATREARETCKRAGLNAKVAVLPDGKDPDDLAREKGPDAVRASLAAARGILEHLIEAALDESFHSADARERAERAQRIAQLIATEDDPTVVALAQSYADRVVQRLGLPDIESFQAMQRAMQRAVRAEASRSSRSPDERELAPSPVDLDPRRARITAHRNEVVLAVVGAFLDFPELLDDPEAAEAIDLLEGDAALVVVALRECASFSGTLAASELLAHVPASLHTFAAQRLAAPRHVSPGEARMELLSNAQKLKRLGLSREKAQAVEALHRIGRAGDAAAEDALLRELERRARERHGL